MEDSITPKEIIKSINEQLQKRGIAPGLEIGATAPNFTLRDEEGVLHSLYDHLNSGPVVLTFYRGDWCGYCRRELTDLNDHIEEFDKHKAKILAIAPQTTEKAKKLKLKYNYTFPLLADEDSTVIKQYNIHFEVHAQIQDIYKSHFKLNIPELNAGKDWTLPSPATFVIDQSRKVVESFVDMDYTQRMPAKEILPVLEKL